MRAETDQTEKCLHDHIHDLLDEAGMHGERRIRRETLIEHAVAVEFGECTEVLEDYAAAMRVSENFAEFLADPETWISYGNPPCGNPPCGNPPCGNPPCGGAARRESNAALEIMDEVDGLFGKQDLDEERQKEAAGVAFFGKQDSGSKNETPLPEDLQIRQFPGLPGREVRHG